MCVNYKERKRDEIDSTNGRRRVAFGAVRHVLALVSRPMDFVHGYNGAWDGVLFRVDGGSLHASLHYNCLWYCDVRSLVLGRAFHYKKGVWCVRGITIQTTIPLRESQRGAIGA